MLVNMNATWVGKPLLPTSQYVFLSTYGVLTPWFGEKERFDAHACASLARLCSATNAVLILVRSQLLNEVDAMEETPPSDVDAVRAELAQHGVTLDGWLGRRRNLSKCGRREVRRFIKRHRVRRWVWVGHEYDRPPCGRDSRRPYPLDPSRYIGTMIETRGGVTYGAPLGQAHVERAVGILNQPLPRDMHLDALCEALEVAEDKHAARFSFRLGLDVCCPNCKYGGDAEYAASLIHLDCLNAAVGRLLKSGARRTRREG